MDSDQGRAVWDDCLTDVFITACVDQILNKQRRGHGFTKEGWKNIVSTFQQKTGRDYSQKQFRNKLDVLKKELKTWDDLNKETGAGWDPDKKTIAAPNEWWTQKIQENGGYRKFRHAGLHHEHELRLIFQDVIATGEHGYAPSYTGPEPRAVDTDNCYRPSMNEEEGSGDSEDEHFGVNPTGSTRLTDDIAGVDLSQVTPPVVSSGSGGQSKRKRAARSVTMKRQKVPPSKQIADAVSVIATASKDRADSLKEKSVSAVDKVMTDLWALPEVLEDMDFGVRCTKLLQDKTARETFASLKHNPQALIKWLQLMLDG